MSSSLREELLDLLAEHREAFRPVAPLLKPLLARAPSVRPTRVYVYGSGAKPCPEVGTARMAVKLGGSGTVVSGPDGENCYALQVLDANGNFLNREVLASEQSKLINYAIENPHMSFFVSSLSVGHPIPTSWYMGVNLLKTYPLNVHFADEWWKHL